MPTTETIKIQNTVFDLEAFEEITLVKSVDFVPAENTAEVLARVGNDAAKMLALLNEGLKEETRRNLRAEKTGWHTFVKDADGEDTGDVNGEYTGTPADMTSVNALKLTLAKTVFGYAKSMTPAEKQASKAAAIEMIKSTPAIKAGLQKSAARS